ISTYLGAFIVSALAPGLSQIGPNEPTKRISTGAVMVVAVVLDTYRSRRARAR
ncbi:ABC transporter permease, partial [Burkholderia sp. SIMBA_019]